MKSWGESRLPTAVTFRGNLLSKLTLLERSQPDGDFVVDALDFQDDSTLIRTTTGSALEIPAWTDVSDLHRRLSGVIDLAPLDPWSWDSYPGTMSVWAAWLTLHYDMALLEHHLSDNVPRLRYLALHRHGDFAIASTELDGERFDHEVTLHAQPLGVAVDFAFEVARQLRTR
jgi:hypothetical protein